MPQSRQEDKKRVRFETQDEIFGVDKVKNPHNDKSLLLAEENKNIIIKRLELFQITLFLMTIIN